MSSWPSIYVVHIFIFRADLRNVMNSPTWRPIKSTQEKLWTRTPWQNSIIARRWEISASYTSEYILRAIKTRSCMVFTPNLRLYRDSHPFDHGVLGLFGFGNLCDSSYHLPDLTVWGERRRGRIRCMRLYCRQWCSKKAVFRRFDVHFVENTRPEMSSVVHRTKVFLMSHSTQPTCSQHVSQ